jgi:hypothetical protein
MNIKQPIPGYGNIANVMPAQPKVRSKSRQNFRAPHRGEGIKAATIRKQAVKDGYKFAKEEA